jgi:threonine aldolase
LVALKKMIDRLRDDHENAKRLAAGLEKMGIKIDMERVQTNMVIIEVKQLKTSSAEFIAEMEKNGVKTSNYGPTTVRMVTHNGIEREDIDYALNVANEVAERIRKKRN